MEPLTLFVENLFNKTERSLRTESLKLLITVELRVAKQASNRMNRASIKTRWKTQWRIWN